MNEKRRPWYLLTGLLIGIAVGILYAWLIDPVDYIDTAPHSLRQDFKDQYRSLIALSYQVNGDLGRAKARLEVLGDQNPADSAAIQAQRILAAGGSQYEAQSLAALAGALQGSPIPVTPIASVTPGSDRSASTGIPTVTLDANLGVQVTPPATKETSSPEVSQTPTKKPAVAKPGVPFVPGHVSEVCDPFALPGLLQVLVINEDGEPVPGVRIDLTWDGGRDSGITGLYPEISEGYADFTMQAETVYSIRAGEGSQAQAELTAPVCTRDDGSTYLGGLKINFSQ